jgi:hypothetical protein
MAGRLWLDERWPVLGEDADTADWPGMTLSEGGPGFPADASADERMAQAEHNAQQPTAIPA